MKTRLLLPLLFFAGLLCGLGVAILMDGPSDEYDTGEIPGDAESNPDKWQKERLELATRIASQSAQIADLQVELEKARELVMGNMVEAEPELTEEERRELARQRFAERMGRRLDGQVSRMALEYGLNEAQSIALKEIYLKRTENQRARRNGEDVERFDMDAALSAVMTEEQFASYLEETQQDIYNRAEMMATTQTVRLSQAMDMHPDVEAMVYDTINLTTQEMMIAHQEGEDFNFREVTNERLGSFLTDEQMEVVQENLRMGRGSDMPGGGGGLGRGGGFPGP